MAEPRPTQNENQTLLPNGMLAPDFTLPADDKQKISLHDFIGRPVVLIFYPADWSSVCGSELTIFNEVLSEFKKHNAQVLGISVDNVWSHIAFSRSINLTFPILSDFEPKGQISKIYRAYNDQNGFSSRALYLIDAKGVIRWSYLSPILENPGVDEVLHELETISEQSLEWHPSMNSQQDAHV